MLLIVVEHIDAHPELLPILRRLEFGDACFHRSDGSAFQASPLSKGLGSGFGDTRSGR
jgi:hypothetical protein